MKPILLYVKEIKKLEEINYLEATQERIIDVQLSEQDAKVLRDLLDAQLHVEVYGAVSFRIKGRLVL